MNKKLVIALGGNALGNTSEEQLQLVKKAAKNIVDLIEEGYTVIVGHGNGPQVGMITQQWNMPLHMAQRKHRCRFQNVEP